MLAAAPKAEVLPLPQFNPQVVNTHLPKRARRAAALDRELRGTVLPSWITRMKRYAAGAPYRFLVEMGEVMDAVSPPSSSPPRSPP